MEHLEPIFDLLTLSMLENAFEVSHLNSPLMLIRELGVPLDTVEVTLRHQCLNHEAVANLLRGAVLFGAHHDSKRDRVKAIMDNVIANSGIFVVDPITHDELLDSIYQGWKSL